MKLRARHLTVAFTIVIMVIVTALLWWLVDPLVALTGAVVLIAIERMWAWRIRRRPEYEERKQLYLRLERWIDAHSCGDLFEVDGLYVQCCDHVIGAHVRLWQKSEVLNFRVDDYMPQGTIPGIRHGMCLGSINEHGELELPQPTSLRAVLHNAQFEQDSGVVHATVDELRELLDRLDRAAPVPA